MDRELLALLRILQIALEAGITIEKIRFCNGMEVNLDDYKNRKLPEAQPDPQLDPLNQPEPLQKTATEEQFEKFRPELQKMILDEIEKFFYRVFPESKPAN